MHDVYWKTDPLAWMHPESDADPGEPVHMATCGRCAEVRSDPPPLEPLPVWPFPPMGHDQMFHAATIAREAGDNREADRLDSAWEAGERLRWDSRDAGIAAADTLPEPTATIDMRAELEARGWTPALRRYARERRLM